MPEYLAPGVVVEEVSRRPPTVEPVPTSTAGLVGRTRSGPVAHPGGPTTCRPRLVTSLEQFERAYGRIVDDAAVPYLGHAVRAFFGNGGRRLHVSRVHTPPAAGSGVATVSLPVPTTPPSLAVFRARWPGLAGNVAVTVQAVRGDDVGDHAAAGAGAPGVPPGTVLEVVAAGAGPAADDPLDPQRLVVLREADGVTAFVAADGTAATPAVGDRLLPIGLTVTVVVDDHRTDTYPGLAPAGPRALAVVLARDEPDDEDGVVWFDHLGPPDPVALLVALVGTTGAPQQTYRLQGGDDGLPPTPEAVRGVPPTAEGIATGDGVMRATGLWALADLDDIAIVAAPDVAAMPTLDDQVTASRYLLEHAERSRYRFAVLDGPAGASVEEIRSFRGSLDSSYGGLYHPWVEVPEPDGAAPDGAAPDGAAPDGAAHGAGARTLRLPPSGFVAGVLARSDLTRGVSHAPSGEALVGVTRLEVDLDHRAAETLTAEGVNLLRSFEGRGHRVWGNRTLGSDPQWRYVTVRRLLLFLEHSIDAALRWVAFEPNDEALWARVRGSVETFLEGQWRAGALVGRTSEQAYVVRCDRSTMTQDDLDAGRLICLVGVAPVRPAEFVVIRIGSWTADAAGGDR